jgi:hypothetical protein
MKPLVVLFLMLPVGSRRVEMSSRRYRDWVKEVIVGEHIIGQHAPIRARLADELAADVECSSSIVPLPRVWSAGFAVTWCATTRGIARGGHTVCVLGGGAIAAVPELARWARSDVARSVGVVRVVRVVRVVGVVGVMGMVGVVRMVVMVPPPREVELASFVQAVGLIHEGFCRSDRHEAVGPVPDGLARIN